MVFLTENILSHSLDLNQRKSTIKYGLPTRVHSGILIFLLYMNDIKINHLYYSHHYLLMKQNLCYTLQIENSMRLFRTRLKKHLIWASIRDNIDV